MLKGESGVTPRGERKKLREQGIGQAAASLQNEAEESDESEDEAAGENDESEKTVSCSENRDVRPERTS